ncbi:hypothetical protein MDAP_000275 [Mitosporidium daphniae]
MTEDVFECRVEFSQLLSPLLTSKKTMSQALAYALSHYSIHTELFDVLFSELRESGPSSSLAVKNLYILLEFIVISSLVNGWPGYRDAMELKMPAILGILFHPRRHLDYHIEYLTKLCRLLAERNIFSTKISLEMIKHVDTYCANCTPSKDYDKLTGDKSELQERFEEERELQKRLRDISFRISPPLAQGAPDWHPIDVIMKGIENDAPLSALDVKILSADLQTWQNCRQNK